MSRTRPADEQRVVLLTELLHEKIGAAGGWLDFEEFMQVALHETGLGYYAAGHPPVGANGDFVTAPEISELFASCLAKFTASCLVPHGQIMELGAGSGKLAAGILNGLAEHTSDLPDYLILEPSSSLQHLQAKLLATHPHARCYQWATTLPEKFCGVIIANEVLDALPCQILQLHNQVWHHYGVGVNTSGDFIWKLGPPADQQLTARLETLEATEGYVLEINRQAEALAATLAATMQHGVLLFIDYGFARRELYHPDRYTGTLIAHTGHKVTMNVLSNPGAQDLTTHIDFSAIAAAAARCGAKPAGFTTQAAFLLDLGIIDSALAKGHKSETQLYRQSQQLQTLLMPHEMGDLFKALALTCGNIPTLPGFSMRNRINELQ